MEEKVVDETEIDETIKAYDKALEIDPKNACALEAKSGLNSRFGVD